MARPGGEQGRQPAARAQAGGQVVVGQRGAHLVVRLVDQGPDPGDVQRAGQARRLLPGPERQQRLVRGQHAAVRSAAGRSPGRRRTGSCPGATWNEACHGAVAPGLRLAARTNGSPAATGRARAAGSRRPSVPGGEALADVYSWTSSPACVWPVPLVTVPDTVTVAPGLAVCGLIESMTTDRRPELACGRAGLRGSGRCQRQRGQRSRPEWRRGGQGQHPPGVSPVASRAHLECYCRSKPDPCFRYSRWPCP